MKISTNWLRDYIPVSGSVDTLAAQLTMVGLEVKGIENHQALGDRVMEIEITSNRPDWLSHLGVAREIAAFSGKKLALPSVEHHAEKIRSRAKGLSSRPKELDVEILDRTLCPYYTCVLLEGVDFGDSPEFMRQRLTAVGMRPVNLIVDITNYVLLETGQPLHAFDCDRLAQGNIIVRCARDGEAMRAINGTEYWLSRGDLVIADRAHPIAIAGVMGGMESEVGKHTKNILLESAYFSPLAVRKTSRKLGLTSESSYRFERGVDPAGVDWGRERARFLILQHAKLVARVSAVYRGGRPPVKHERIPFPLSDVKRTLGVDISPRKIAAYLRGLGIEVRTRKKGFFLCEIPSFRQDLARPIDLVEEVARLHGYDQIPESLPLIRPLYAADTLTARIEAKVRETVLVAGLNEVVTFSLVNEKIFKDLGVELENMTRVINPQNKELTLMRPTLFSSLLEVVKTNYDHGSGTSVRIFEVANVYGEESKGALPKEKLTLGLAVSGVRDTHWLDRGRKYVLFDLKGMVEELFSELGILRPDFSQAQNPFFDECFSIGSHGQTFGILGRASQEARKYYDITPEVFLGELRLEEMGSLACFSKAFKSMPRYPSSRRDIALLVGEKVAAGEVVEKIRAVDRESIKSVDVIDLYQGGKIPHGKKSLAFSLEYRAHDRTLTSQEIQNLHAKVIESVRSAFGAELRV